MCPGIPIDKTTRGANPQIILNVNVCVHVHVCAHVPAHVRASGVHVWAFPCQIVVVNSCTHSEMAAVTAIISNKHKNMSSFTRETCVNLQTPSYASYIAL